MCQSVSLEVKHGGLGVAKGRLSKTDEQVGTKTIVSFSIESFCYLHSLWHIIYLHL